MISQSYHYSQRINPIDPPYQASPDFPPNKAHAWSKQQHQQHHAAWEHLHQAVRDDVENCLLKTLKVIQKRSTSLQAWEVDILQSSSQMIIDHLNGYLAQLDNNILPYLKTRINLDTLLHSREPLLSKAEIVSAASNNLKEGDTVMALIKIVKDYLMTLDQHLKKSFAEISPLFQAFFTPEEARSLLMKTIGWQTKYANGSFLYHMLLGGGDESDLMSELNIPPFVWILVFRPAVRAYTKDFVEPLKRVETNKPPSFRFLHNNKSSNSDNRTVRSLPSSFRILTNNNKDEQQQEGGLLSKLPALPTSIRHRLGDSSASLERYMGRMSESFHRRGASSRNATYAV